ncbi:hypothetical protein GCM10011497_12590 [Elstera cyanobacteriorum]|nr:hypothetical protein GCM10011497_12590 [Elstera cyanobacteriorum]
MGDFEAKAFEQRPLVGDGDAVVLIMEWPVDRVAVRDGAIAHAVVPQAGARRTALGGAARLAFAMPLAEPAAIADMARPIPNAAHKTDKGVQLLHGSTLTLRQPATALRQ